VSAESGREVSRKSMVSVRLDPDEELALKAEAAEHGQTLSQYIRSLLVRRKDVEDEGVDYHAYPVSTTGTGQLALEATQDGLVVPKTSQPYVSFPH